MVGFESMCRSLWWNNSVESSLGVEQLLSLLGHRIAGSAESKMPRVSVDKSSTWIVEMLMAVVDLKLALVGMDILGHQSYLLTKDISYNLEKSTTNFIASHLTLLCKFLNNYYRPSMKPFGIHLM